MPSPAPSACPPSSSYGSSHDTAEDPLPVEEALINLPCRAPLRMQYRGGSTDTLVVSLAGAGRNDFEKPCNEFYKTAAQGGRNHVLFVIDDSRSWLNGPGVADQIVAAIRLLRRAIGASRVVALGNSMGGTMALHLAQIAPIDAVIALTPQYSVDPKVLPDETRWQKFRDQIERYDFRTLDVLPEAQCEVTILHGDSTDELRHAERFPRHADLSHYILPGFDHELARDLHMAGALTEVIASAIEGRRARIQQHLQDMGAELRSPNPQETPAKDKSVADRKTIRRFRLVRKPRAAS